MKVSDPKKIEKIVNEILAEIALLEDLRKFQTSLDNFGDHLNSSGLEAVAISMKLTVTEKKVQIWDKVESFIEADPHLEKLIVRMLDHNLIEYLTAINFDFVVSSFEEKIRQHNVYDMQVAIEFSSHDLQQFRSKLAEKLGEDVFLKITIRPNILGGFVLNKGNSIIDASVQRELEDYRSNWVANLNANIQDDNI